MRRVLKGLMIMTAMMLMTPSALYGQAKINQGVPDQDTGTLRKDLLPLKRQLVEANMQLTDTEAPAFWQVYDQYAAETIKIYDARSALIKEYSEDFEGMVDAQAEILAKRYTDSDEAIVKLRQRYLQIFSRVIGGKKTAIFFQVDRRLTLTIDLQLAYATPPVEP
ncbi:MAG TPA: hypothetical protein VJS64_11180 [Pyrinomonadaceae bacterium]|nr:hypothetical protein [Pyrinomonadaceae bacterium]